VRFIYTRGQPGVRAWDLPGRLDPRTLDVDRYAVLLERAAAQVLGVLPGAPAPLQENFAWRSRPIPEQS